MRRVRPEGAKFRAACPQTPCKDGIHPHLYRCGPLPYFDRTDSGNSVQGAYVEYGEKLRRQAGNADAALQQAVDDFLEQNRKETEVTFPRGKPSYVVLLARARIDEYFAGRSMSAKPNGWEPLRQEYPDALIVSISQVGLSRDGTVAVVYVGQSADHLLGSGEVWVFRRTADG